MAKADSPKDRVKRWQDRIATADKLYDDWSDRFKCKQLVDYYEGFQWYGQPESEAAKRYTINLIFPTIEIQLPSILFYRPQVQVDPRPAHSDDQGSHAPDRAQLAQDTLQTFVDDPQTQFKLQTLLSLRDSEFRFGLIEVGYSADWLDNPGADKPLLKPGTEDPVTGEDGQPVTQPTKVPRPGSERVFLKRIPPETARISASNRHVLAENEWVGYYEWHLLSDVKANPKYKHTGRLKRGGTAKETTTSTDLEQAKTQGMVKLWKIWDFRAKQKLVLADGLADGPLLEEPFTYCPLAGLKFFERTEGWYPIPPVANWVQSQDEINEIRESRRAHRRRFYRRYTYKTGNIETTELEKLESGGDGVYAKANVDEPLRPVQDAPLGGDTDKALAESRDDFLQISGVGAEARGQAEADTATQANIIEVRSRIRESGARAIVADWLGEICRLMLLCVVDKMQLPFWIQIHQDPFAPDLEGAARTVETWQQLRATALSGLSVDVKVDVTSLSPVTEQQQLLAWNQVLALITNPQMAMLFSLSEPLLKKTLTLYGLKNPREIAEIQKVMGQVLQMQMLAQASAMGGTASAGQGATATAAPSQPPAGIPASGPVQ